MSVPLSSGDLLADRRYRYAEACLAEGDAAACADLAAQALEIAPGYAPAWLLLGRAREGLADPDGAREAYAAALGLDPQDVLGAGLHLARLGAGEGAVLTPAYVRALFDGYAPRFERHLVEGLRYVGPALITDILPEEPARFPAVLDLGCGTGLAGAAIAHRAGHLTGVDLSPAMLALARGKGCYDRLVAGELGAFLAGEAPASADLCIAADVFIYCADLAPVLARIGRVLRPGGWTAFTVQSPGACPFPLAGRGGGGSGGTTELHPAPPPPPAPPREGEGSSTPTLGPDGRYAHPDAHLRAAAGKAGLTIAVMREDAVRFEGGGPVPGRVVAAQRTGG